MDIESFNNKVLIIKDNIKDYILDHISNKLINIKIITLSELKKKYYFDYDKETIYYICKNYNVISSVAKKYIDNLYYIKDIDSDKIKFLSDLKNDLLNHGLLYEDKLFKSYLIGKDIVLYNIKNIDLFYENIFNEISKYSNIERVNYEHDYSIKKIYNAGNIDEEISFVASKICELIKSGVNINSIKLANVSDNYYYVINNIFGMFNIPINLNTNISAKGSKIVKKFKELFSNDLESVISEVGNYVKTNNDNIIYKKIIDVLNDYSFTDNKMEVKDLIFEDIDNIKVNNKTYKNAVNMVDIDSIISDEDYVFLINFTEGNIPVNHKNEDYLSDEVKSKLCISTSSDLNVKEESNIRESIRMINHLIVTYPTNIQNRRVYVSPLYDENIFEEDKLVINYNNSNLYNKTRLLSFKDSNNKYGTISDEFIILNKHYPEEKYMDYSNQYTNINNKFDELTLSYTSVNTYYECSFKYYISNVLKLDKYEDSFEVTVGNIFHHILSKCYEDDFDFDMLWNNEVDNSSYEFNNMEKYFLVSLHARLESIINVIKKQLKYTSLNNIVCEKRFLIDVDKDLHITFKGFVDKIMYDEVNGESVVVVIDYKTGNASLDLNKIIYGLGMQLPVYVYLIKNSNEFNNVRIGGFYLQNILNNSEEELEDNLKLQGYTNSDLVSIIDSSYENSKLIKSMKTSNNGFYQYSKIINDEGIDKISNIIKDKINDAGKKIINNEFDINPKQIKDDLIGCRYCKYKDICYMKNEDIVKLDVPGNILGGEIND